MAHKRILMATIGAAYQDQGLGSAKAIVEDFIIPNMPDASDAINFVDAPRIVNGYLASQGRPYSTWRITKESGRLSHLPTFVAGVYCEGELLAEGNGTT